MTASRLDRSRVRMKPLAERRNRTSIEIDRVDPARLPAPAAPDAARIVEETLARIRCAHQRGRPVVLVFGAHTIKNGLGPVLIALMERGWVTHLGTNGAGIIHDWEFSFLGQTSEHVRENVRAAHSGTGRRRGTTSTSRSTSARARAAATASRSGR